MASYDQSIVDVLRSAVSDAHDLVRSEIALAKAELREEGQRIGGGIALLAAAAVAGLLALTFLATTLAWALAAAFEWPVWAGFAIVTVVLTAAALLLGLFGRQRMTAERHLPRTVDTLKENAEWIRHRTS
jgi:uncharacterized membrane protein YqjE